MSREQVQCTSSCCWWKPLHLKTEDSSCHHNQYIYEAAVLPQTQKLFSLALTTPNSGQNDGLVCPDGRNERCKRSILVPINGPKPLLRNTLQGSCLSGHKQFRMFLCESDMLFGNATKSKVPWSTSDLRSTGQHCTAMQQNHLPGFGSLRQVRIKLKAVAFAQVVFQQENKPKSNKLKTTKFAAVEL